MKMIGISVWRILLLVSSVQAVDFLYDCTFNTDICNLTIGGDGFIWKKYIGAQGKTGQSCSFVTDTSGLITPCQDIQTPPIANLSEGPACVYIVYKNNADYAKLTVNMFTSNTSYGVGCIDIGPNNGILNSLIFKLPYTSYNQVSLTLRLTGYFVEFIFYRLTILPCPQDSELIPCETTGTSNIPETITPIPETITPIPETTTPIPETITPIPETITPLAETTTPMSCDLTSEGKCFQYFDVPKSHQEAQETCESLGGQLAELREETVKDSLMSAVKSKNLKMWIGANDLEEEGRFVWESDNEKLTIPKSWWMWGEPNNWRGKEDCIMMRPPSGRFNDAFCDMKLTFYCQI